MSDSCPPTSILGIGDLGTRASTILRVLSGAYRGEQRFIGCAERSEKTHVSGTILSAEAFAREFKFQGQLSLIGRVTGTESKVLGTASFDAWISECAFIFGSRLSDTRGTAGERRCSMSFVRSRVILGFWVHHLVETGLGGGALGHMGQAGLLPGPRQDEHGAGKGCQFGGVISALGLGSGVISFISILGWDVWRAAGRSFLSSTPCLLLEKGISVILGGQFGGG